VDAALLVHLIERQANGVGVVHALHRGDARQVGDGADEDFGIGDASLRLRERGGRQQAERRGSEKSLNA